MPDTPIKIRVPIAFRESYTEESGHRSDKGRIKPDRFQPPFLTLPDLKICYEGHTDDPGGAGKLPFYCYLAYVPGGDATKISEDLQAKLKETFKDTPDEWQKVDARTPADTAVSWRMMRVTGDQQFYVGNPSEAKTLPGIFELWIHETGEGVVIVAWRTPVVDRRSGAGPHRSGGSAGGVYRRAEA